MAQLCSERLARLTAEDSTAIPIAVNHHGMSSFPDRKDVFYEKLIKTIQEIVTNSSSIPVDSQNANTPTSASGQWQTSMNMSGSMASLSVISGMCCSSRLEKLHLDAGIDDADIGSVAITRSAKLTCHMINQSHESASFVRRVGVLEKIRKALGLAPGEGDPPPVYALCGLGGIGKTRLALSYAFESKADRPAILWADASSKSKLAESFSAYALKLGLVKPANADQTSAKVVLLQWFSSTGE